MTHTRVEQGCERARLYHPKHIIVIPHFLFKGTLVKKIFDICAQLQEQYSDIEILDFPGIGLAPELFFIIRQREFKSQLRQTQMCKFRITPVAHNHSHDHYHHINFDGDDSGHEKIWQVP
nr:CbiX/SirB N-terminal domain-containing protein [cyanobacterium endosymbiont of Epithemia turgida]